MGDLSSLFLFTAALCADSFAASFVCGTGKIKIPRSSAWILAFCPAAVLAAASALGTILRPLLQEELPVFLSASLLMLLGFSRFTASQASASVPGKSGTKQLSASGSFFLAMGLSSDNGAAGLGAGLAGASLAVLFFLSLILSFTSVRLGAKSVKCVYRRRIADMTALPEEIEGAMAEGCEVLPLKAPVAIQTDENGKVTGLVVQPQVIGEVRGGRPAPRDADQPQEVIPCDVVLMAVGQAVDSKDFAQAGVPVSRNNIVAADDGSVPGMEGVFSGGDCVSGPATVILAVAAGKVAAASIDEYLGCHTDISANLEIPPAPFRLKHATGRVDLTEREASWRKNDFELMENCMSEQEMAQECSRCLRCDHYGHAGFKGGRRETW